MKSAQFDPQNDKQYNYDPNIPFCEVESDEKIEEISQRRKNAEVLIRNYMMWTAGAGFIPIPLLDVAAVAGLQKDMIQKIAEIYEYNFTETEARAWATTLAATAGARLAADTLKLIPGIGTIIGGISMAALSGASTYAIGKVFVSHFESGGNTLNFDPQKFSTYFKQQYEKGLELIKKINPNKENSDKNAKKSASQKMQPDIKTNTTPSLTEEIKELHSLIAEGVLSEEEFEVLKKRLIAKKMQG